jgi:beta-1,4-N-acetylglucosaminyltransferase
MWIESSLCGIGSVILVTVGTHSQQFDRLVSGADQLAAQLNEKVIIQRGCSNYVPRYAEHFRWTSSNHLETLIRNARVVISQSSAGAIILALKFGRPLVLVSRLKRYGENHDDHQQQLARALAIQGRAVIVKDPMGTNLLAASSEAAVLYYPLTGKVSHLERALSSQLSEWSKSGVEGKN